MYFRQISSSQWKKFIEAGRLPSSEQFQTELWKGETRERSRSQLESPKKPEYKKLNTADPSKRKLSIDSELMNNDRRQPAKGVPTSFGYVKKNSAPSALDLKRHDALNGKGLAYKTANVTSVPKLLEDRTRDTTNRSLERPKTRLKVSGGTQTDMGGSSTRGGKNGAYKPPSTCQPYGSYSDSEYQSNAGIKFTVPVSPAASTTGKTTNIQTAFKSYSLTTPIANQLSTNIRERLMLSGTQSLPKTHLNQLKGTPVNID